jgi:hypothetical protein
MKTKWEALPAEHIVWHRGTNVVARAPIATAPTIERRLFSARSGIAASNFQQAFESRLSVARLLKQS